MKPDYRADIDGLRGIAVLAVLLYHADFVWFSGGFVGVDVFFVISGYLITSIILREVQALDFSVLRFYERRVRRIFPALFVTLAITFVGGAFLLSPRNFKTLGDNAVAVTLFFSNIRFWNQSGYFDAPAEENPLLHTWSLAVEEQFYILFPLLLVGIRRFLGSRFALCLSIAGLGSLLICIYGTWHHPGATFYWAPTRAWELFLGGVLACNALPLPTNQVFRNAVAASGLALVLSGIFLLTSDTPFPGVAALLPTIGTALVIYTGAGEPTAIGRLVSSKPLVFIGLISYSLYLFHWPLIVFARRFSILALTSRQTVVLLLITAVLSALSWRFVERPFRSRQAIGRTPLSHWREPPW